ncbi:lysyl-tRNA synthetase, class I [Tistrella mobilis KA081020-065]|uniref:Lysine--tRNA ligase n=2 Tax=Tistrella mobilis TaxID=171437 RepID=I3TP93_TISMK|nr:lysyl-tRNA synthetase, class I [Tistrella mobilis KA081020-065]
MTLAAAAHTFAAFPSINPFAGMRPIMTVDRRLAAEAKAWPFKEAQDLAKRLDGKLPAKGYVLFETGYGPSGLPHIGTFGEVARTTMVRRAFEQLTGMPTKLIAFSDDMDGLRKVPDNIPNQELVRGALGKPLTAVPDPFGTHASFGAHNNARLRAFLDAFGFDYEFRSATDCYRAGAFDDALRRVLERYDEIMKVMLPTLGEERQKTYSPILPVSPSTGRVLQVPILSYDAAAATIVFQDEDGTTVEQPVTGGRAKLQWKADWAMRWVALDVDYEMYGKDLIPSAELSGKIARILGGRQPNGFAYELFLDAEGQKISKSKGNGLSIEDWLRYGSPESLSLFMFQQPKRAKRLYFDVIPRAVDDYYAHLRGFHAADEPAKTLENPAWHIHGGNPPAGEPPVGFSMLLNLASACNAEDKSVLWGFITRYAPEATPETQPDLDRLVGYAVNYYQDFVKPQKRYKLPDAAERAAIEALAARLGDLPADATAEAIQDEVYEVGKAHGFENLRAWFKLLYEVLLGQEQGPRMGSFIQLYGRPETIRLIEDALAGKFATA